MRAAHYMFAYANDISVRSSKAEVMFCVSLQEMVDAVAREMEEIGRS